MFCFSTGEARRLLLLRRRCSSPHACRSPRLRDHVSGKRGLQRATGPLRTIAKNAMTIRSVIIRRRRPACIGVPPCHPTLCTCMCRRNTYARTEEEVEEEGCAAGLARLREWVHRTPAAADLPLRLLGETRGVHRRGRTLLSLSLSFSALSFFSSFFYLACILLSLSFALSLERACKCTNTRTAGLTSSSSSAPLNSSSAADLPVRSGSAEVYRMTSRKVQSLLVLRVVELTFLK